MIQVNGARKKGMEWKYLSWKKEFGVCFIFPILFQGNQISSPS